MVGSVLRRILFPLILWFLIVVLSTPLIPVEFAPLRPLPAIVFLIGLVYWWLTGFARWLVRRWRWITVGYLLTNLAVAFVLMSGFFAASYALTSYDQQLSTIAGIVGLIAGPGWLLWSLVHLLRYGQRRRSKSIWWRLLSAWLDTVEAPAKTSPTKPQPAKRQSSVQESRRTSTRTTASAPPATQTTPKPAPRKALFTQVGAGGGAGAVAGVAIPPRTSTPRIVGNDPQEFLRQAQDWALRQEYVGNYVPFDANYPTYRQMSFEQQQWYFYWRTQLRQGKFLVTDLSYLFVYVYELLNLVGVSSPTDARDRLIAFWRAYRPLQPKLDNYLVDWVADFGVLNNLSESTLPWYAQSLREGATNRNTETLQLEAWHQQGRDYNALPATILFSLANYATQQNKFYQAYQTELALDESLKRGVAAIDGYVQEAQRLSLYELHLPVPTQTVVRLPLQGAVHRYPTTPIVIGRVRPWLTKETLQADLKAILRYTENILRVQAAYKTKLRGVTLPPAWVTILDQAFVKAPPKRVVSIDLAGAAALQRESDELRQRLLDTGELTPDAPPDRATNPPLSTPVVENAIPASPRVNTSQIQRPDDTAAGLLTDLSALVAIMGDASSEATALLRALRDHQWQGKPTHLKVAGNHPFMSLVFDRVNERALVELGDALLFIEGDEWVVAEDYRDEIAYLLDHPDFAAKLTPAHVSVEAEATSTDDEQQDLIPTGWEESVRQLQPLHWATLAIVLEQSDVQSKLEILARSNYGTASQLLDQTNEIALATVGDNLIDVAVDPPQIIDEYSEPLRVLLLWAKEHDQIEGLP